MNVPKTDWSDAHLVERCLEGDERAWVLLVDRYKNLVYSVPLKYGVPREDAADIFQAVWLDLFHDLARLRDAGALGAWLIRVATHKCYHWNRQRDATGANLEDDEIEAQPEDVRVSPDTLAEIEREQAVCEAIDTLPPRCREMIRMLFFEQPPLRYAEVAQRLHLAPGSIGFIRGRCLKRLKQVLEKKGF